MRAASYSRFSTDKQTHAKSIDGQQRLSRAAIAADGHELGAEYFDDEISGALPIERRPGSRKMMADAQQRLFDVLYIESLQRFSRDLVDQETMIRRLEFQGIVVVAIADGYRTKPGQANASNRFMRVVLGGKNELDRFEIAAKVHRGLVQQIAIGGYGGGLSFGYRSVIGGVDARGEPTHHRLEVVAEQAEWVVWIFQRYVEGLGPSKIAHQLNGLGVKPPRGRRWATSAIYGHPERGAGVLNNELYRGVYIWNRSTWQKDPDTGKRIRFMRPPEEVHREERPELRIVDEELWDAARKRMLRPRVAGGVKGQGGAARTLFSGMLVCGLCGGPMIATSATSYGCARRKDSGPTACHGMYASRPATDARLMSVIHDTITGPAALEAAREDLRAMLEESRREHPADPIETRRASLERQIANLVDAIAGSGQSLALKLRLQDVEAELAVLRNRITPRPRHEPSLAALEAAWREEVLKLREALQGDVNVARPLLKDLLGTIRMVREGSEVWAELPDRPQRLLLAAGGGYSGYGCGDPILHPERRRIRIT